MPWIARARSFSCELTALAFGLAACAFASGASARHLRRPRFEPADLELEDVGHLGLDLQLGLIRSAGPWRVVAPDFEITAGVLDDLELSLDGAYAVEGPAQGVYRFDHSAPDVLWLSGLIGLLDYADVAASESWAIGLRFGPKLPNVPHSHGLGVEGLLLAERTIRRNSWLVNLGALIDPAPERGARRPIGIEGALGFSHDFDAAGRYSCELQLSGIHFLSPDPNQLVLNLGLDYQLRSWLELSITDLVGLTKGSDRYGLLLGAAASLPLWKPAAS